MKTKYFLIILASLSVICSSNAQWIQQSVPSNAGIMLSIDFANTNTGVSCGNRSLFFGKALQTTNGGTNWYFTSVPDSSRSFVGVDLVDSLTGYMVGAYNLQRARESDCSMNNYLQKGFSASSVRYMESIGMNGRVDYSGLFVKTTNGGRNWFTHGVLPPEVSFLLGIDFINANTGVITASIQDSSFSMQSTVLKTTNGGLTWDEILDVDSAIYLWGIEIIDENNIITAGYGGRSNTSGHSTLGGMIFKSTDGGQNWNLQHTLDEEFRDVKFTDFSNGFVASNSRIAPSSVKVYRTTNQGNNWNVVYSNITSSLVLYGISFYNGSGTGMVYGEAWSPHQTEFAIRTTDNGNTWGQLQSVDTTGQNLLHGGAMPGEANNYICGGNPDGECVIYHTTNGGITAMEYSGNSIPQMFSLSQNYPNPFNPKTIINYQLTMFNYVSLKVFDALGKEVATLVNEKQSATGGPGTYQVEFDGSNLPSGVYFYKLTAGEFTDTKKMVLIK